MLTITSQLGSRIPAEVPASGHRFYSTGMRYPSWSPTMRTKTCTKCRAEYPATAEFFPPNKRHRDGFTSYCRKCNRAQTRAWTAANFERHKKTSKDWAKKNPEKIVAASIRYHIAHPEVQQQWRAAHPQCIPAAVAKWKARHPEAVKAHDIAKCAVRSGRLMRPTNCEHCGKPSRKLHKHHKDYTRPLDVIFVCPHCHKAIHRQRKSLCV